MRLARVHVKNFRCLEDVSVDIGDVTILLGPNSAGKSSFLHALRFFFDEISLEAEDVYAGGEGPVSVECVFDTLNSADREALGPYGKADQVVLRRNWSIGEEPKLTGRGRRFPRFAAVREKSGGEKTQAYRQLRESDAELDLPQATNIHAVEEAMLKYESENPGKCEDVDDDEAGAFLGFGSVGRSRLAQRFRFIFVPGVQDAAQQSVEAKGTLLTRLLTAVAEQRATANEQLQSIEDDARDAYEKAIDASHGPILADLGDRLTGQMRRYVPTAEVKLEPTPSDFSLNPPSVDLRGGEDRDLTDIGRQGHGFQRAFVISVLEYLAESQSEDEDVAAGKPTLFLAIEEPELYQHPPRARHLYRTLLRIASDGAVQVGYATHSPYFVSADRFDGIRIFRRERENDGALKGTRTVAGQLDRIIETLPDPAASDPRPYLARTLDERFREAFFANAVLIVEGPSDEAVFEEAALLLGKPSLSGTGVAIVTVGKGSQPVALAILRQLEIPAFSVFDGDADAADGEVCDVCKRQKTDRTAAKKSNRKILRALGAEEVDFPETTVAERWACFHREIEDSIEGFRKESARIANEMGWRGKSPEAYALALDAVGAEKIPESIGEVLDRVIILSSHPVGT